MKEFIKKLIRLAQLPFIIADFWRFYRVNDKRFSLRLVDVYPCIKAKTIKTRFDRHYVYFTAWAARQVRKMSPEKHVDISSSLYFAGIVSAFVPVEFYDYRPADLKLSNLESKHADLTHLPFDDNSVTSLSCMHVVEHIGLGRYGDTIDSEGDLKAAKELSRVLARGGKLLFVVPIGAKSRIEYNAHRIYSYKTALSLFPDLKLEEFTLIPEKNGAPISNTGPELIKNESYACGCFVFTKL